MAVVFTDNFTGVSGTAINGRAGTGGTWSCAGATAGDLAGLKINATNQVRVQTSTGCLGRIDVAVADHYAKASSFTAGISVAAAVRAIDHNNFIGLRIASTTQIELFKRIGGIETSIVKLTVGTITLPAILQLGIVGTSALIFFNGAQVGTTTGYPIADALFVGVTRVGLWGKASALDPAADDFEGGAMLTALLGAGGRSPTRDRNAGLSTGSSAALTAGGGRSITRDQLAAVTLTLPLGPTRARSASRDPGAALVLQLSVAPMGGRSGTRGAATNITMPFPLGAASGRSAARAGGAMLKAIAAVRAEAGRSALRTGSARLSLFERGVLTPVASDQRTVPVPRA